MQKLYGSPKQHKVIKSSILLNHSHSLAIQNVRFTEENYLFGKNFFQINNFQSIQIFNFLNNKINLISFIFSVSEWTKSYQRCCLKIDQVAQPYYIHT